MRVFVTGTRGIPNIPGGVEKHCQELLPRIASRGHDVMVTTRSSYDAGGMTSWQGVRLLRCFAPRKKNLEAIVHTFLSLLNACSYRPDVVHIHAVGPALLTPVARLLGFKVVFTNHGPDYKRQKWSTTAKLALRLGEKMGGEFASEVIAISSEIKDIIRKRCNREAHLIYNGVSFPTTDNGSDFLKKNGIKSGKYVLAVARFVPEKGLHDLMEAFAGLETDHQLVIAGDADHESDYSIRLRESAAKDDRIVLTGYITGKPLAEVFTHAALFVLPSYHEGLPISLLEAMSHGLPVLASDIPANREVGLPAERYFQTGNVRSLRDRLEYLLGSPLMEEERRTMERTIAEKYDWDKIAEQTIGVYEKVLNQDSSVVRSQW